MTAETRLYFEGQWQDGASRFALFDKFSGDQIADVAEADEDQVARAVAHATAAFRARPISPHARAEVLRRAAEMLRAEAADFAATYRAETGFTARDAAMEVARTVETLTVSAEEARRFEAGDMVPISGAPGPEGRLAFVLRVPIGPVAAITPFNAPLNTVAHKLAPAMAAGNPVILKPSSHTPLCSAKLVDLMLRAGWPEDMIALLQGSATVGKHLLAAPDIAFYTFTGSTGVGRAVQAAAGLRRTQLELGSIAFTILAADADLDRALPAIRDAAFRKAGQVCTSVQIVLAARSVTGAVIDGLADLTRATPFGDPSVEGTITGPMIARPAAEAAEARITAATGAGARLIVGGGRDGSVVAPTLLADVPPEAEVVCEEMFAPVMTVIPFDTLEEAIARVNATPYGLATGVFTARIDAALQAARGLDVGCVHIGNTSSARVDLMPYGGVKESGFGREGPAYAMREMSEERLITITP